MSQNLEAYLEPCQISKDEALCEKVNGRKPLTVFAKRSISNF